MQMAFFVIQAHMNEQRVSATLQTNDLIALCPE